MRISARRLNQAEFFNAIRRFETSLKRRKCANSGHSAAAWRTGQIDQESRAAGADEPELSGALQGNRYFAFLR
jgi:hypothetical protein